jgi:hypothetical protein
MPINARSVRAVTPPTASTLARLVGKLSNECKQPPLRGEVVLRDGVWGVLSGPHHGQNASRSKITA